MYNHLIHELPECCTPPLRPKLPFHLRLPFKTPKCLCAVCAGSRGFYYALKILTESRIALCVSCQPEDEEGTL